MTIHEAADRHAWDVFLKARPFSPFLQSWTMGDVYADTGQQPIRLEVRAGNELKGICQALIVPARRGKHLSIPYGPVLSDPAALQPLIGVLKETGREHGCRFIRFSPHWPVTANPIPRATPAPLHLLAEHLWYVPLRNTDPWQEQTSKENALSSPKRPTDDILKQMRSTQRNLIRRAEKDGVTIVASDDPKRDLHHFIRLHDETRQRHKFTPYSNRFFEAQVRHFSGIDACTLYLAHYQGDVIAASIHVHFGGETSYHHGASTYAHLKIPASYLLQWRAMQDALDRGDGIYNFWGIAPTRPGTTEPVNPKHPFAGVTLFKTGFGGCLLELQHCSDLVLKPSYYITRTVETVRKWKRGF